MNTLYCTAADKHPAPHADPAWPAEQSFCTQLGFALERPAAHTAAAAGHTAAGGITAGAPKQHPAPGAPADLQAAERIAGTYTVSYNAANGLLALSGTLNVDGATYFIDDQLTIDREASFAAFACGSSAAADQAGSNADAERSLSAWSVGELPANAPALKLLAGLALMAHLGLKPQRG